MVNYLVLVRNRTSEIEWEQWYQHCVVDGRNTTNSSDHKSFLHEWECNLDFMMNVLKPLCYILFCASIILAGVYVWDTTIIKKSCVWKRRKKSRNKSQEEQTRNNSCTNCSRGTDDDGSMVISHCRHCYDINNDNDNDSNNDTNTDEPTQPKFENKHETIVFVSKLFLMLAIYFFLALYPMKYNLRGVYVSILACSLALVGYNVIVWYITKLPCMNKKTTIQLQAADIFQDFAHTSTVVAVSSGIVQSILLLLFMSSILKTFHNSYLNTFKITNQTSITDSPIDSPNLHYTEYQMANQYYLLASLLHATYAVGMNDIFSAVHSYFDFWLDTYYYWYHNNFYSTFSSWFWFGTGQNTGKKNLICSSDESSSSSSSSPSSSRSISFFALAIRSLFGLFLNVFGQVFITLLLPLRLAFSKNAFDFVLNATAALFIVQLVYLPNIEYFTLSTSTSLQPREEEAAAAATDNDDDTANAGMTPPAYKHKKMISIAHHGRRGLARGRRGMMDDTADGIAAIPYRYSKFILDRNSTKMNNIAGIEFREYPKYKYIEYDQPQAMKDVMKRHRNRGYTPLDGFSHSITSAKLLSSRKKGEDQRKLYQTTKITQPIQDPITTNNVVSSSILDVDVKDTECTQLIAVARLSNPWFNYAYQHDDPHARMEDMLSFADTELRFALQNDFGLVLQPPASQANNLSLREEEEVMESPSSSSSSSTVMATSESMMIKSLDTMKDANSEQNVVFVNYDALSGFDPRIGEVWITIKNDDDIKKIHDCNTNNVADSSRMTMIMGDDNTV